MNKKCKNLLNNLFFIVAIPFCFNPQSGFQTASSKQHILIKNNDLKGYGNGIISNPIFKLGDVTFVPDQQDDHITTTTNTCSLFLSVKLTSIKPVNAYLKKHNNQASLAQMMNDSGSSDHAGTKLINSIELGFYNPNNVQLSAALTGKFSSCKIHTKRNSSGLKDVDLTLNNNFTFNPISLDLSKTDYSQDMGSTSLQEYIDEPYFDFQTYTFKAYPASENHIFLEAFWGMTGVDLNRFIFYLDSGDSSKNIPAQYKLQNFNSNISFKTTWLLSNMFIDWIDEHNYDGGTTVYYQNSINVSGFVSYEKISDLDYPNISKIEFANVMGSSSISTLDSYKIYPSELNFYNIFNELMDEDDKDYLLLSANLSNTDKLVLEADDFECSGKIEQGDSWNDWNSNYLFDEWNPKVIEKLVDDTSTAPDYINISQNWEYRVGGRHPVWGWIYNYRAKESFTLRFKYINAIGEQYFPVTNPNSTTKPRFEFYHYSK